MKTLALTGATGFVGKATVEQALAKGYRVRALTRRAQKEREGVEWVQGDLDAVEALDQLAQGADALIHIAGVVNAPTPDGFVHGNVTGTQNVVSAAKRMGVTNFVHVSSLSAREPDLSLYGKSKADGETVVINSGLNWAMVRPPGVYGPGDMEMRDIFRMAKKGLAVMPPAGRVSLIHVQDLAALLVALFEQPGNGQIFDCDDGFDGGYTHRQFAQMIGAAVGSRPVTLHTPAALLHLVAKADRLFRGDKAKLTPDRAAYLSHSDWTADPAKRPPTSLWSAKIDTQLGLRQTADWYRAQQLL